MNIIINSFSLEKFRMRLGKRTLTVKTEVYEGQNSFKAFSFLSIDRAENFVGYGESINKEVAGNLFREHLKEIWLKELLDN